VVTEKSGHVVLFSGPYAVECYKEGGAALVLLQTELQTSKLLSKKVKLPPMTSRLDIDANGLVPRLRDRCREKLGGTYEA